MKELEKHIGYYLALFLLFFFFIVLMLQSASDIQLQAAIAILATIVYVFWGIIHHRRMHDLTGKIVVEYVLIGSLGICVVLFFLKGGSL